MTELSVKKLKRSAQSPELSLKTLRQTQTL